jgi:hypothetical protein
MSTVVIPKWWAWVLIGIGLVAGLAIGLAL